MPRQGGAEIKKLGDLENKKKLEIRSLRSLKLKKRNSLANAR